MTGDKWQSQRGRGKSDSGGSCAWNKDIPWTPSPTNTVKALVYLTPFVAKLSGRRRNQTWTRTDSQIPGPRRNARVADSQWITLSDKRGYFYIFFTVITMRANAFYPPQLFQVDWHSGPSVTSCLCQRWNMSTTPLKAHPAESFPFFLAPFQGSNAVLPWA